MTQGLWVALLGMLMVFSALGLVMVVIVGIDRAFRQRPAVPQPPSLDAPTVQDRGEDRALAAAIGLALALATEPGAGAPARPSRASAWRLAGRRHQMARSAHVW